MQAQAKGYDCTVVDRSPDYAQLAIQGPTAAALVQTLTKTNLADLKYYHFTNGEVAGGCPIDIDAGGGRGFR